MSLDIPNRFTAKTSIGSFDIKITNREYITIGTKQDCVQIFYNSIENAAKLDWLGTEKGGCEIMVNLGFTILKQLYPNVNPNISLLDSSTFVCRLPDNKPISISNMIYNLLITGKTYYQNKFNATLRYKNSERAYHAFVKNRLDPAYFDKYYNFYNNDLNIILQPILQSSNNWGEFFNTLYTNYGRQSCVLMHSWYKQLYGFLAQDAIHNEWVINMDRKSVEYAILASKHSTRNYTRKSYVYNPYVEGGYYPTQIKYNNISFITSNITKTLKHRAN